MLDRSAEKCASPFRLGTILMTYLKLRHQYGEIQQWRCIYQHVPLYLNDSKRPFSRGSILYNCVGSMVHLLSPVLLFWSERTRSGLN